jgi:putative ABC transport system ATP-binding protein
MAAAASFGSSRLLEAAPPLVQLRDVSKEYDTGGTIVRAMRDVSLEIGQGEFVAIVGASGSGKSTMMNILGCLDRPTRGAYTLAGVDVGDRGGDSRAIVRNRVIGFIFQGFNLLPRTTALENVELPLQYRGVPVRERRRRARAALEAVGLATRMDHTPNQLSGGQQQRVAIARALVTDPPLLLADEPTGNLDTRTSLEVLALLQRLNRGRGITIVLVTHEHDIAACASRVVTMRDGSIVSDERQDQPLDAAVELGRLPATDDAAPKAAAEEGRASVLGLGGPVPFSVYAMMWLGEFLGIQAMAAYLGLVLRVDVATHAWVAVLAGQVGQAIAGARWARRRLGRPATNDQRVRMAFGYTTAVTCPSVFVAGVVATRWRVTAAAGALDALQALADRGAVNGSLVLAALLFMSLGVLVLLRYLLLTLFAPRR